MAETNDFGFVYDLSERTRIGVRSDIDGLLRDAHNFGLGGVIIGNVARMLPVSGTGLSNETLRKSLRFGAGVTVHAFMSTVQDIEMRHDVAVAASKLTTPVSARDLGRKRSELESLALDAANRHPEVTLSVRVAQAELRKRDSTSGAAKYVMVGAGLTLYQIDKAWAEYIEKTSTAELHDLDFESLLPPLEGV